MNLLKAKNKQKSKSRVNKPQNVKHFQIQNNEGKLENTTKGTKIVNIANFNLLVKENSQNKKTSLKAARYQTSVAYRKLLYTPFSDFVQQSIYTKIFQEFPA